MIRLAPDLFDRRYDDLVEAGRSRLPSLAPRWTDYNAHDPGIMLMELLAWVTEAQLYSLGRMRRDERVGYAALLGLRPEGPTPAHGLLWADRNDRESPARSFQRAVVLEADASVRTTQSETPVFHPTHRLLWTPGRVVSLRTRLADGTIVDQTRSNERGDRAFEPFGSMAGPSDVLRLEFATNGASGLFPVHRQLAAGALWSIGVRVDPTPERTTDSEAGKHPSTPLSIQMRVGTDRTPLRIIEDGTRGFMRSGALLLDVSNVSGSPQAFALDISAPNGFARPPRILQIEPGVVPIVQGGTVMREAHAALGVPMQRLQLAVPGLQFGPNVAPIKVEVIENGERHVWQQVDDLARSGPDDRVYELDTAGESIVLGNGVNGRLPAFRSAIFVDYPFCNGTAANMPRNQRWSVRGIDGVFGINPDAVDGGRNALRDDDLRREARRRLRHAHALVTSRDIEDAAKALPDLEVARASVRPSKRRTDGPREVVLVVLRLRTGVDEPEQPPETPRWLAAVRRALLPRLPLGTRLRVRAPVYRSFAVRANVEALPRRNPTDVADAIKQTLRDEFTVVPRRNAEPRKFGTPVSKRDLAALIRGVAGVRRIRDLALLVDGVPREELALGNTELPRLDIARSSIDVTRAAGGSA